MTTRGMVNFPTTPPDSSERMYVRLIVLEGDGAWLLHCCSAWIRTEWGHTLVGFDTLPPPSLSDYPTWAAYEEARSSYDSLCYPWFHDPEQDRDECRWTDSLPLLAAVLIGTADSLWRRGDEVFRATYDDLTDDGKALYALLKALYPGHTLVIETWVDT